MLTTIPRNTKYETVSKRANESTTPQRESGKSDDEREGQPARPTRHKPSAGKEEEESTMQTMPHEFHALDGQPPGWLGGDQDVAAVGSTETGPKDTKNSETSNAIRSSERRQKMSAPTANHTNWKTLSTTTLRSAYERNDSPMSPNARTPSGVGLIHRPLRTDLGCGGAHATIVLEAARNAEEDYRKRRDGHRHPSNAGREEPASAQGSAGGWRAHPTVYSTLLSWPFRHNPTLQHYRLPTVTTTVTRENSKPY